MANFAGAAAERYVLCWWHEGRMEKLAFPGHVFHPTVSGSERSVWFELVSGPSSTMTRFDPITRTTHCVSAPVLHDGGATVSPDGHWVALTRGLAVARELWVRAVATGKTKTIAGGRCDNREPVGELDSSAVVFASDCGRGYGLPALYRASWAPRGP